MQYIQDTMDIQLEEPSIVTLGKFDGFHRGHQKLISYCVQHKMQNEAAVVFTFSTSPQIFLTGRAGDQIVTRADKLRMAAERGVDVLIEYPFTDEVRRMPPVDFLEKVLIRRLNAKKIVVGPDCRFGYQGKGTAALLQQMAPRCGYELVVVEKEMHHGEEISSTRIKACLRQGQIAEANRMLGYDFGITGPVVHGRQLGRTIGIPTINQEAPPEQVMPLAGVYHAEILLESRVWQGIANVGRKPTIEGERPVGVETYIFDFDQDIYGRTIRVNLLEFIRLEQKFESVEALKQQIRSDEAFVRGRITGKYFE